MYHLLKISWQNTYFSGCSTYLTVVLNLDLNKFEFRCEKYQLNAKSISVLQEYMRGKNIILNCDQYNFTSSSDVGLKIHQTKIHHSINLPDTYQIAFLSSSECEYCDLDFSDKNKLKNHMMEVHDCIKRYYITNKETLKFSIECEYCVFNFNNENKQENNILEVHTYTN